MALISISIDIAGSTKIKKEIKDFSSGDTDNINKSYKDFLIQLYNLEMDFYYQLTHHGLDLNNFFVVKTIGDEIWMIYDLSKTEIKFGSNEFNEIINTIIRGLIDINSKDYHIVVSERKLTADEEKDARLQEEINYKYLSIIPHVFVDLIENYEEANHVRNELFNKRFSSLISLQTLKDIKIDEDSAEYSKYINNLNFGAKVGDNTENKEQISFRFDPMGFEIDKFFRCTNHGYPGIVAIGQKLFENLFFDRKINVNKKHGIINQLKIPHGNNDFVAIDYYRCIYKTINKEELKGIDEDYKLYYLFKHDLLPNKIHSDDEFHNFKETIQLINQYQY